MSIFTTSRGCGLTGVSLHRKQEEGAIELYRRKIEIAGREGDQVTRKLFVRILSDEEGHHKTFVGLIEAETKGE